MPSLFDKEAIISLADPDHDVTKIQNSFITLEFTMNLLLDNKFDQFSEAYKEEKNINIFVHSFYENVRKDDILCCGRYLSVKTISEAPAPQSVVPYDKLVNFTVSIPLDDLLIFSVFSEYPNSLFGDIKIKFKINPQAFIYCQVDPIISMARYVTICKDELMSSGQSNLKDIDLFFRNWSLTFQYTNMFTQIGCAADLIIGVGAEELTPQGLKKFVYDVKSVTISVRNYIITAVLANISGYKASEGCHNHVLKFYSGRSFVVPAQRIESWAFPSCAALTGLRTSQNILFSLVIDMCLIFSKDPRFTTCFVNPCYQNMQITILSRNFSDFPMNTFNEQFFTTQLQANNINNIVVATDEYEDSL
ncbi:MAG: hypothetical protein EZS28_028551, partial [Streblomastix strix]